jgi:hypothetical protein
VRLPRIPQHIVVLLSATTAGYAAMLAGVTAIQADHEAALMAQRAPAAADVAALGAAHDRLATRLESARAAYAEAADGYARASVVLDAVDAELAGLASAVAEIDGVSRNLPTTVRVPVQRTVVRVKAPQSKAPQTHATTSASGG